MTNNIIDATKASMAATVAQLITRARMLALRTNCAHTTTSTVRMTVPHAATSGRVRTPACHRFLQDEELLRFNALCWFFIFMAAFATPFVRGPPAPTANESAAFLANPTLFPFFTQLARPFHLGRFFRRHDDAEGLIR